MISCWPAAWLVPAQAGGFGQAKRPAGQKAVLEAVSGQGCYAYGDNETPAAAREAALALAQKQALRGYRVYVEAATTVKNLAVEEDLILSQAAAVLRDLRIVKSEKKGQEVCVSITAKVDPAEFERYLQTLRERRVSGAAEADNQPGTAGNERGKRAARSGVVEIEGLVFQANSCTRTAASIKCYCSVTSKATETHDLTLIRNDAYVAEEDGSQHAASTLEFTVGRPLQHLENGVEANIVIGADLKETAAPAWQGSRADISFRYMLSGGDPVGRRVVLRGLPIRQQE
jgi:hypothetical protein